MTVNAITRCPDVFPIWYQQMRLCSFRVEVSLRIMFVDRSYFEDIPRHDFLQLLHYACEEIAQVFAAFVSKSRPFSQGNNELLDLCRRQPLVI